MFRPGTRYAVTHRIADGRRYTVSGVFSRQERSGSEVAYIFLAEVNRRDGTRIAERRIALASIEEAYEVATWKRIVHHGRLEA